MTIESHFKNIKYGGKVIDGNKHDAETGILNFEEKRGISAEYSIQINSEIVPPHYKTVQCVIIVINNIILIWHSKTNMIFLLPVLTSVDEIKNNKT